jgi:hypothetical protein
MRPALRAEGRGAAAPRRDEGRRFASRDEARLRRGGMRLRVEVEVGVR